MPRNDRFGRGAPLAWAVALGIATVVGALATSCMMPFVALSVMAAATLSRPRALLTVASGWLANQVLGVTVQHVPLSPYAISWGVAAGVAALAVTLAASFAVDRKRLSALRTVSAFALGFALYEGLLFAFANVAGGVDTFTPAIIAQLLRNECLWLAGLAAVHLLLTWRAPRWFGRTPALNLA